MRRLIAVALAALVIVVAVLALGGSARLGKLAPALPQTLIAGQRVTLASLRGKPAIIHFWASNCAPCTKEAPQLARLAAELHGRATLVGIDDGLNEVKPADGLHFARLHHWTFPLFWDPNGVTGDRYAVVGLPTTFVLNSKGRIVAELPGAQTAAKLLAEISSAG